MKFTEFKYERPQMEVFKTNMDALIEKFSGANSAQEQIEILHEISVLRNNIETAATLVSIRHTINTEDTFYDAENDFIDDAMPTYEEMVDRLYNALNQSKFKDALRSEFGEHLFNIVNVKMRTFRPEILEDLKLENSLVSKYTKLRTSAKIMFEGEERNLAQMTPFYESTDRSIRKSAQEATTKFFEENEKAFDDLYDELVKVRHNIAQKLGFDNFVELGYLRLARTDYDHRMVKTYRDQVLNDLVPIASKLKEKQRVRLGLETLTYYDEPIAFNSGNATPKGTPEWILKNGKQMYESLSEETGEFFNFMLESELMDLEAKQGKAGGGYCTFIPNYKSPFIFSNFNGTSGDIDVLTHEAGHAFQVYQSRNYEIPEYVWPTLEACEIHSMSMEFLTWPWMESFFKEDTAKYHFNHLSEALLFIPYGVLVDEFQHYVYENPEVSPAERKSKWAELETKYLPHTTYEDNDFLKRGGYWFRQGHIFMDPFYYIDYTLAQVCAFQFFVKAEENRESAWADYIDLCNRGGSLPFLELLKVAKLENPFEAGSLKRILPAVEAWLDGVNDRAL
ncbi:M3 family oligoendopeptidase [Fusibacter ferrireducens]|uniref:M3 family oligoendopeptidase n=1 Tax=Fusibacter ferrireducens TaxID=2785058 RepID=A0ABR9ZTS8_9FIRM|nr:M3 family oligoendopeptidase [Fusibacter ferrireducens]MBF4693877.1 M3 family oligoendopeptidase [Fusibacter ferrireducens]